MGSCSLGWAFAATMFLLECKSWFLSQNPEFSLTRIHNSANIFYCQICQMHLAKLMVSFGDVKRAFVPLKFISRNSGWSRKSRGRPVSSVSTSQLCEGDMFLLIRSSIFVWLNWLNLDCSSSQKKTQQIAVQKSRPYQGNVHNHNTIKVNNALFLGSGIAGLSIDLDDLPRAFSVRQALRFSWEELGLKLTLFLAPSQPCSKNVPSGSTFL